MDGEANMGSPLPGIASRIRDLRRASGKTQKQLAEECGVSASYIGLMETGDRPVSRDFIDKACAALHLEPQVAHELTRLGEEAGDSRGDPKKRISTLLKETCKIVNASSCTLYVPDAFWPHEWRLVATHGVKYPEPMHGFVCPNGTWRVLELGPDFCPDTSASPERRDRFTRLPNTIKKENQELFNDFVGREKVKASARLMIKDGETDEGLLFVNFSEPTDFTENLQAQLFKLRDDLAREIAADKGRIPQEDVPMLQQAMSLLRPMQDWVSQIGRDNQHQAKFLESILDDVMSALEMDPNRGFGTIHLYRPETDDLVLVAHRGAKINTGTKIQSVVKGQGIISWVAIRQRALVIEDLEQSLFKPIFVSLREKIVSALAVPMMVGDVLAGVLNLESEIPHQFKAQHARALWYAAGGAGVAARLRHEARTNTSRATMGAKLLELFCLGLNRPDHRDKMLNAFAEIARDALGAKECDIWKFDPSQPHAFSPLGATNLLEGEIAPREKGLSDYVSRNQCKIWVSNSEGSDRIDASFWNGNSRTWESTPPRAGAPEDANRDASSKDIPFQFGIPIVSERDCIGVAWLKFSSIERSRPTVEEVLLVEQFVESVGLILKFLPQPQQESQRPKAPEQPEP